MVPDILILLGTYNGERYLPDQLQSIERQTITSWRLLACDDGSSDRSRDQLERFRSKHPDQVEILDLPASGSAAANFFRLLRAAPPARCVVFCDQDDVWAEGKLQRLLERYDALERQVGPDKPCLVHSDLTVVNADLEPVAASFSAEIGVKPESISFGSLLVENAIPGCSMLVNRPLVELFRLYQGSLDRALMHDWWLALIAFSMGTIAYVPDQLVMYRQHDSNAAGSVKRRGLRFATRKLLTTPRKERLATSAQAKLFLEVYGDRLPPTAFAQVSTCARLPDMGKWSRIEACLRLGILKQGVARRIYQFITI